MIEYSSKVMLFLNIHDDIIIFDQLRDFNKTTIWMIKSQRKNRGRRAAEDMLL